MAGVVVSVELVAELGQIVKAEDTFAASASVVQAAVAVVLVVLVVVESVAVVFEQEFAV